MRNQALSKVTIAVTVLAVAVAGGLYLSSKKKDTENVPLETYSNGVYGISFKYPETYDLSERTVTGGATGTVVTLTNKGVSLPQNGEGPTSIEVGMFDNSAVRDVKDDPIESWIRNSPNSNFHLSRQSEPGDTRIDGKDALLYTWDGLYQGTSVVTEHNGNIIMFSVTYDGDMDMQKRRDFTKMMNTVQFENATSSTR